MAREPERPRSWDASAGPLRVRSTSVQLAISRGVYSIGRDRWHGASLHVRRGAAEVVQRGQVLWHKDGVAAVRPTGPGQWQVNFEDGAVLSARRLKGG